MDVAIHVHGLDVEQYRRSRLAGLLVIMIIRPTLNPAAIFWTVLLSLGYCHGACYDPRAKCSVVCSDTASLPEIAGDSARTV
jgi:hypothetical protein